MKSLPYGLLLLAFILGCSSEAPGPNLPPVALAGGDRVAEINQTLVLDGTASFDPDGDRIRFEWELIAAHPADEDLVTLSGFREPQAQITLRAPGTWMVRLQVDDGEAQSLPDIVTVTVPGNLSCEHDSDCDDDNPCNGVETCENETCLAGTDLDCDDQNECTDDDCDPMDGCTYDYNQADCIDGDPCTVNDACDQGACGGIDKVSLTLAEAAATTKTPAPWTAAT